VSAGRRRVVQHDYPVVMAEAVGQVRADLAQPACDENCLHRCLMAAVWILILCLCRGN